MNPNLKPIYKSFTEANPSIQIKPELFQISAIAYLKENNESMELLIENKEAQEEFKLFISNFVDIQNLLSEYS